MSCFQAGPVAGCPDWVCCRACRRQLKRDAFFPSLLANGDWLCRKCSYAPYRSNGGKRVTQACKRIARLLAIRERKLVKAKVRQLTPAAVQHLVEDMFEYRSSLTQERVPLGEVALVRADESRPFDPHTNAALLSMADLRSVAAMERNEKRRKVE
jgi:hypothetical protein